MFKIGDFSRVCRIPVSALRYYADIGLLEPAEIDSFTGYRYYSLSQLPRLNRILALKDLGLSLTEIKRVLESDDELSVDELRGMLKLKQAELEQELADRQAQLNRVAARLQQIQQEGKMPEQEVVLKQLEAQYVLSYRFIADSPDAIGPMLMRVYPALYGQGIMPSAAPGVRYHSEVFDETRIDTEIIYPVNKDVKDKIIINDEVQVTPCELPAEEVASIIHKGEYDTLSTSYAVIGQWIESNQYQMVGPVRELYLTAPDDPEGPITEIQFPVKKA